MQCFYTALCQSLHKDYVTRPEIVERDMDSEKKTWIFLGSTLEVFIEILRFQEQILTRNFSLDW